MGAALVLLLVGLGALAAGVLIGRYYVPDDRQLRRTARHSRAYIRALSHLLARDYETVIQELRAVVEENVDDVEPYFALGAVFRSRGEHERAIRVHQALAMRERERRKLRQRAMYELGLDFRAAGMPRRATRAMEEVVLDEPDHDGALRVLAALYEEQARFNEAASVWQRLGKRHGEEPHHREHHLLVAAAQAALSRDDLDSAKQLLKAAQKHEESAHFYAAAAELAAARGNHRGARDRLKQALIAEPALAPHLLPGLLAAEQGLVGPETPETHSKPKRADDDLDDEPLKLPAAPHAQLPGKSSSVQAQLPAATQAESTLVDVSTPAQSASQTSTGTSAQLAASSQSAGGPMAKPDTPLELPAVPLEADSSAAVSRQSTTTPATRAAGPSVQPGMTTGLVAPSTAQPSSPVATSGLPPTAGSSSAATSRVADGSTAFRAHNGASARGAGDRSDAAAATAGVTAATAAGVLAVLAEVEAQTGPRLELLLIRAQLLPAGDTAAAAALADQLAAAFPESLAARVATARLALAGGDARAVRGALASLVGDGGAIAWALHGRWQCANCGKRPDAFSWRCGQCRRWGTLRMETGIEPPPPPPRERRAVPRGRLDGLLGAAPDESLPAPTLDSGLAEPELAAAGARHSLLGRVGGWVSGIWRRDAS